MHVAKVKIFNHLLPSNAELKNEWRNTSILPIGLRGVKSESFSFTLIKQDDLKLYGGIEV
jgi:hypothetical protein